MDGKRALRPQGSDGSDHGFRQRVADSYAYMATLKARLVYTKFALLAAAILVAFSTVMIVRQ